MKVSSNKNIVCFSFKRFGSERRMKVKGWRLELVIKGRAANN